MRGDWFDGLWAAVWQSDIKWTDIAIVVFTFGQVWIGIRQTRISRRQTEIASSTREISVAALGRPYIFFEFISHNFDGWRKGDGFLRFYSKFVNYGSTPGVVEFLHAKVFLSYGPHYKFEVDDNLLGYSIIKPFPRKKDYADNISVDAQVYLAPSAISTGTGKLEVEWKIASACVLRAGEDSATYQQILPRPRMEKNDGGTAQSTESTLLKLTEEQGPVRPWLVGSIVYKSVFNIQYRTNFCVYGSHDGTASEWEEEPYTKRP